MSSALIRGLKYWFKAYAKPGNTLDEFRADPDKVEVSFWINLIFAFLYSITPLLAYLVHRDIRIEPWLPIAKESYYLYQTFWTIPWGIAVWILLGGVSHLLAIIGKKDGSKHAFDDALMVITLGWVMPWFVCGWLPETLVFIPFDLWIHPLIDILRFSAFPVIWQTILVAYGLRRTHGLSWIYGIVIGLVTNGVMFIMFFTFLR